MFRKLMSLLRRPDPPKPMRIYAQDVADMGVIAQILQDAIVLKDQVHFDPDKRFIGLGLSRYCHEIEADKALRATCLLQIHGVLHVRSKHFEPGNALSLLTIEAEPKDDLAYGLRLIFAGPVPAEIECHVECLDVWLRDTSAPHRVSARPVHD